MKLQPNNISDDDTMASNMRSFFDRAVEEVSDQTQIICPLFSTLDIVEKRYIDAELINSGGMKKIYKVFDTVTSRYVAMAKLHEDAPQKYYDPFIREARLTGLLEHPNIMTVHDIGSDEDGTPFFTMELKDGDSLDKVIGALKHRVPGYTKIYHQNDLLEMFIKVCDAVAYAHSKGAVHLDIKPSNIQIGDFGEVLVCDWGLGKIVGTADENYDRQLFNPDWLNNMTLTGDIKGTPGYMAPEQITEGGEKTMQTDIYALGCLLYSILTYSRPISGKTDAILKKTVAGAIIPPAKRYPKMAIPYGLSAVTMKAVSLLPENRYETVAQLRSEVHSYLAGFATNAENATRLTALRLFYKRNSNICHTSISFCVLIAVLVGQFVYKLNETMKQAVQSKARAENVLIKYQNERKRVAALNVQKALAEIKEKSTDRIFYHYPVRTVWGKIKKISSGPQSKSEEMELALLYMIAQDFDSAALAYKKQEKRGANKRALAICEKFRKSQKTTENLLSVEEFVSLMNDLSGHCNKETLEHFMIYDAAARKDMTGYEEVVKVLLSAWNGDVSSGVFKFDDKTKILTVRGEVFKVLGADSTAIGRKSFLAPLSLKQLNISGTKTYNLAQLRGLDDLEVLDIRNTLVTNLEPLEELSSLKVLKVTPHQFAKAQLQKVPESVVLVVE